MTTISSIDNIFDFTQDYEVVETLSIEETVGVPDSSLEDEEEFLDIEGVISIEQAAEAIEEIIQESVKPVVFNEKLIPTGGVIPIIPKGASDAFIKKAEAMNAYAIEVTNAAA